MKNIQKIAEEIFKAPTVKELINRQKSSITEIADPAHIDAIASFTYPDIPHVPQLITDKILNPIRTFIRKETTYLISSSQTLNQKILEIILDEMQWKKVAVVNHPELPFHSLHESTDGSAMHWEKEMGASHDIVFLHESIFDDTKNSKRIADNIFKAPTADELLNRTLEYGKQMTRTQVKEWLSQYEETQRFLTAEPGQFRKALTLKQSAEIMHLFPTGAKFFNMNRMIFEPIDRALYKQEWELIAANVPYPEIHWQKSSWQDKNLVRAGNGILLWEL